MVTQIQSAPLKHLSKCAFQTMFLCGGTLAALCLLNLIFSGILNNFNGSELAIEALAGLAVILVFVYFISRIRPQWLQLSHLVKWLVWIVCYFASGTLAVIPVFMAVRFDLFGGQHGREYPGGWLGIAMGACLIFTSFALVMKRNRLSGAILCGFGAGVSSLFGYSIFLFKVWPSC